MLPPPRDAHTLPCTLQRRTLPLKTDNTHRSSAGLVQAHALHACTPSDQLRRDVIVQTMVARIGMRKKIVECGCTPPADESSGHCNVECRSQVGNFRTARVTTAEIVDALVSACLRAVNHARSSPYSLLAACRLGKQLVQSQLRSTTPPLQRGYAAQSRLVGPDSGRTTPEARRSCSIGSPTNRPQEAHAAILRFATRLDGRTMNGVSVNTTLPSSRVLPDTLNTPQPRLGFSHGLTCSAHLPLPATHERISDAYGDSSKRLRDAAKQHFVLRRAWRFHAEGFPGWVVL